MEHSKIELTSEERNIPRLKWPLRRSTKTEGSLGTEYFSWSVRGRPPSPRTTSLAWVVSNEEEWASLFIVFFMDRFCLGKCLLRCFDCNGNQVRMRGKIALRMKCSVLAKQQHNTDYWHRSCNIVLAASTYFYLGRWHIVRMRSLTCRSKPYISWRGTRHLRGGMAGSVLFGRMLLSQVRAVLLTKHASM